MRAGLLAPLMLAVLAAGYVMSGNYGRMPGQTPAAGKSSPQVEVLAETPRYRLVKHPLGESKVPRSPRRIVSLSAAATDSLAALGVRPVLVESAWKSGAVAPYLARRLDGVPAVRRTGAINLEAVVQADPDLIFAGATQDGRMYGQLGAIAPTVCLGTGAAANRETAIVEVGAALGKSPQALRRLAEYHRHVAQARQKLSGIAQQPVAFLRFRQRTCVIYAQTAMFGPLLFDGLGLAPDPAMPRVMAPGGWDVLSMERLSTLRARRIFLVVDTDSDAYLADVAQTPIWRQIPAVRQNRVYRVAASTWLGGEGVLANEAILEDVTAAVAGERRP